MVEGIILAGLALYSFWVIRKKVKNIKEGRCSCGCGSCSGCSGGCALKK